MKPLPPRPPFSPTSPYWNAARETYQALRAQGLSNPMAIGILANFDMESCFQASAIGDQGKSFNMEQWQGPRIARILAGTGINVVTERSIPKVVQACLWELENVEPYKDALPALRAAQTAGEVASLFCQHVEGAGALDAKERRAADALWWTMAISAHNDFFSAAA